MTNLSTKEIAEIGSYLSEKLKDNETTLEIKVDKMSFYYIDEDLFYRLNKDKTKKFVPSENEIDVNINNVKIKIIADKS